MAKFIITNKGLKLQSKVLAGTCKYEFTKIAVGDGYVNTSDDYTDMDDLQQKKADVEISDVTVMENNICEIAGVLTNENLTEPMYVREVGLYAKDPDKGEIMFCAHYYDLPTVIDVPSSGNYTKEFLFDIGVSSSEQVNLTTPTVGLVSANNFQKVLDKHTVTVKQVTDFNIGVKEAVLTEDIKSALLRQILPATAAAHNSIYRGKDLTSYWNSGEMSKAIEAGTFDDIFPGDYIIKDITVNGQTFTNVKWLVADLDYYLHRGDIECTTHHALIVPENNIGTARMNATDITTDGYLGSEMWKTTIPKYVVGIKNAFGDNHVLKHRDWLTDKVDNNAYSSAGAGWKGSSVWTDNMWQDVSCNLLNGTMMFGHSPFASSGYDTGCCSKQLAIFHYGQNFTRNYWCWLRDVADVTTFCHVSDYGLPDPYYASHVAGVRVYFLLH